MNENLDQNELQMCFKLKQTTSKTFKELVEEYRQDLEWYFGEGYKLKVDVQTPQKVPELKPSVEEVQGVYYGREIISEGKKQDGSKWVLYKVKIKTDLSDKPLTFSTFNGTKGFHELKEENKVLVKYKSESKVNKDGKQYTAKNAIEFISLDMDELE